MVYARPVCLFLQLTGGFPPRRAAHASAGGVDGSSSARAEADQVLRSILWLGLIVSHSSSLETLWISGCSFSRRLSVNLEKRIRRPWESGSNQVYLKVSYSMSKGRVPLGTAKRFPQLQDPSSPGPRSLPKDSKPKIPSKIPNQSSQATELSARKCPNECSQTQVSKRRFLSASSKAKVPKRTSHSESSQTKDLAEKISSGSSQAKVLERKFPEAKDPQTKDSNRMFQSGRSHMAVPKRKLPGERIPGGSS